MAGDHSRLLKFLVDKDSLLNMSDTFAFNAVFNNPTKIESEVPRHQKLRELTAFVEKVKNNSQKSENKPKNGVDVAIIEKDVIFKDENDTTNDPMAKEEAVFPKDNIKLQKSSVIEVKTIHSEVPSNQILRELKDFDHKLKKPTEDVVKTEESKGENEEDGTYVPVMTLKKEEFGFTKGDLKLQKVAVTEDISENEEKKPRSRIPKMNFRQVAERVRKERRRKNQKAQETPTTLPRRSSIPRLKKRTVSLTEPNNNVEPNTSSKSNEETIQPEDEFDKIYDEILHTAETPPVTDTTAIDEIKIDDAEELEHNFEEIIHDYEENKVQPIDIKLVRSRIPLVKQKSLPDDRIAKKLDRRSSLKVITIDDDDAQNIDGESSKGINNLLDTKGDHKKETVKVVTPILNKIETQTPKYDKSKVNYENDESTVVDNDNQMPDSSKLVKQISIEQTKKNDGSNNSKLLVNGSTDNKKHKLEKPDRNMKNSVSKGKVSDLVSKITSNDQTVTLPPKKVYHNEIPKKKSIMSKIAVFNKDKNVGPKDYKKIKNLSNAENSNGSSDKIKKPEKILEKFNLDKTKELNTESNNITPPNTPICYITVNENMMKENVITLPIDDDNINTHIPQENVDISKENNLPEADSSAVDLNRNNKIDMDNTEMHTPEQFDPEKDSSLKAVNISSSVEEVDEEDEKEIVIPKGKVSRIINRIVSREESLEPKKETVVEVPIKKSVSSRIAMFERQSTVDSNSHKPKIIDEVLKPLPPRTMEAHNINNDNVYNNVNNNNERQETNAEEEEKDGNQKVLTAIENVDSQQASIVEETIHHVSTVLDLQNDSEENGLNEISDPKHTLNHLVFNEEAKRDDNTVVTKDNVKEKEAETKHSYNEKEYKLRTNNVRLEDRLRRMQSKNEGTNIKKKSAADLKLEEAVKGKVHQMVVRMNSMENLVELEKKSNIIAKERPRKKSVFEKIALFEQKLTASELQSTRAVRQTVDFKSAHTIVNSAHTTVTPIQAATNSAQTSP